MRWREWVGGGKCGVIERGKSDPLKGRRRRRRRQEGHTAHAGLEAAATEVRRRRGGWGRRT
jgi:hypothetical protein